MLAQLKCKNSSRLWNTILCSGDYSSCCFSSPYLHWILAVKQELSMERDKGASEVVWGSSPNESSNVFCSCREYKQNWRASRWPLWCVSEVWMQSLCPYPFVWLVNAKAALTFPQCYIKQRFSEWGCTSEEDCDNICKTLSSIWIYPV